MKIKCPRCQAWLTFDIETQSMECEYCGSIFGIEDCDTQAKEDENYVNQQEEEMDCKIMTCSSCGGELMINETESATFCAYCGQPTLVMSRMAKQKKPKFILPFKITKEEAEKIVRNRFKDGFFVPDEVRNFKVDKLHGVYIPYRVVDVYCQDELLIRMEHRHGKSTSYSYHYRKLMNSFEGITVDASDMLNDESSVRLEPYNLKELVPFDVNYLSGFYANCMDTPIEQIEGTARARAIQLFLDAAKGTVKSGSSPQVLISHPYTEIDGNDYVMLPAWFLSFRQAGKNYTMMVNGQTGKCVGALPPVKRRVVGCIILLSLLFSPICIAASRYVLPLDDDGRLIGIAIVAVIWLFWKGLDNFKRIKKSYELTSAKDMKKFANDRQEG